MVLLEGHEVAAKLWETRAGVKPNSVGTERVDNRQSIIIERNFFDICYSSSVIESGETKTNY